MSGKYIRARLIIDKGIAVLHFIASSIPGPDSLVSTAKPRPTVQHSGSPPKPNKNGELHIQTAHLPAKTPAISLAPPPKTNEPAGTAGSDRANATFVSLVRDSDLWDMIHSIRQIEDRFNRNYHYDWVFLNDGDFSEEFKKLTSSFVSGKAHYGKIPTEHWSYPEWIDQTKAAEARRIMEEKKIIYGGSSSYRHMCRYESGFFFRHELMLNYDYYWRVEPSVKYFCDVGFDAFKFMRDNKKKYSFVLSLHEYKETVLTLWDSVKKFMEKHPEHIVEGNNMEFVTEDGGKTYNMCHFVCSPSPQRLDC
ncbi:alpha 1,2-mannosyltransferase 2.4.1 [Ophidiomyces ophidiicola]|nr:alpha 1,2-mannosyltransferase 2.4.1 [Ophidiomyces ophidiicola]